MIEHSATSLKDLEESYQLSNHLSNWCNHAEVAIDDLGCQVGQILHNIKLIHDNQTLDKQAKDERRKKRELKNKK